MLACAHELNLRAGATSILCRENCQSAGGHSASAAMDSLERRARSHARPTNNDAMLNQALNRYSAQPYRMRSAR